MYILCNIFMFDLHQHILLVKDGVATEIATCELDNLSDVIAEMCDKYSVDEVHLIGNENYSGYVADFIRDKSATQYSKRNIEVRLINS